MLVRCLIIKQITQDVFRTRSIWPNTFSWNNSRKCKPCFEQDGLSDQALSVETLQEGTRRVSNKTKWVTKRFQSKQYKRAQDVF